MSFSCSFPRRIVFGRGSIEQVPRIIVDLGLKGKVMLVTGRRFARRSGYLSKLRSLLSSSGMNGVIVFDRVEPNPSVKIVEDGSKIAKEEKVDLVMGFGGGSAMDTAKGIAILAAQGGKLQDYYHPSEVRQPILPVLAIPTTCGTGSEVTRYAVFSEKLRKNVVVSDHIVPTVAILDPLVLKHLPREILAHTAMDALSHALESYFHVKASSLSEAFSVEAFREILANFKRAYDGDMNCRERLLHASMLAGFAISMSGTTVVHGLGYYLTEKFGLPHGLANSLFVNQFIEYVARKLPERMLGLAAAIGLATSSSLEAGKMLIAKINELKAHAGLPMNLSTVSIPESELQEIIKEGFSYRRNIENCQAEVSINDLREIVEKAFKSM